jgi:hypothetical protein
MMHNCEVREQDQRPRLAFTRMPSPCIFRLFADREANQLQPISARQQQSLLCLTALNLSTPLRSASYDKFGWHI